MRRYQATTSKELLTNKIFDVLVQLCGLLRHYAHRDEMPVPGVPHAIDGSAIPECQQEVCWSTAPFQVNHPPYSQNSRSKDCERGTPPSPDRDTGVSLSGHNLAINETYRALGPTSKHPQ